MDEPDRGLQYKTQLHLASSQGHICISNTPRGNTSDWPSPILEAHRQVHHLSHCQDKTRSQSCSPVS